MSEPTEGNPLGETATENGRNPKKAKGETSADTLQMGNAPGCLPAILPMVTMAEKPLEKGGAPPGVDRTHLSYKEKLMNFNGRCDHINHLPEEEEEEEWLEKQKREDLQDEERERELEEEEEDLFCPVHHVDSERHKRLCKKWRNALIIKVLGRKIGAKFLYNRLQRLSNLKGGIEFNDLENEYFVVRFVDEGDYAHVLHDGPWIMANHYVTVQRWRPFFDPFDDSVRKLPFWIRVRGLPLEFYTTEELWDVGRHFGKTLKIDPNSINIREVGGRRRLPGEDLQGSVLRLISTKAFSQSSG